MKYLLVIIILSLGGAISAQNNFEWTEVVQVDSTLSQKELYSRAKMFVATTYVSSKAVTDMSNDQSFTILIKPIHEIGVKAYDIASMTDCIFAGYVRYMLIIETKDGKYRYTIKDCVHEGYELHPSCRILSLGPLANDKPLIDKPWKGGVKTEFWNGNLKQDFKNMATLLIAKLKEEMGKPAKSDW